MAPRLQHAEWLRLVEISGPFLSLPVLDRVFPQGLDALDRTLGERVRLAYDEWADDQRGLRPDPAMHRAWVAFVLDEILEVPADLRIRPDDRFEATSAEHHVRLRPNWVVLDADGSRGRLLVCVWPAGRDLSGATEGEAWTATPLQRTALLCRETEVRLGLVTNGEDWTLVHAPVGETAAFSTWYGRLWRDEPLTLRAFQSLLGARRFYGASDNTLEAMLTESLAHQEEVTEQLGTQVRHAVEVLVQALDRADKDTGGQLLAATPDERLYEAAVTVMMRLVFLFSAEERDLLLLGDPVYDQCYAASPLAAQLRAEADRVGLEVLERRQDAWSRLCATFRAVHGGVEHDTLRVRAYGGSLFDPDRFPFLEGRAPGTSWREEPAQPLPIDNRTVLHLLEALQLLSSGAGARRLSFRGLDVEQIGHVYEGLLDHQAIRLDTDYVGFIGARGREPEVRLDALEQAAAAGTDELVALIREETGRSASAIAKRIGVECDVDRRDQLLVSCANDQALLDRVVPYHALLRHDVWGYPVVYPTGSVIVTAGLDRRSTQTYYTPLALTEEIVQYALEPLVYVGPAEGRDREAWELKMPQEILDLKVCDPAMGSGAFLVQACRWLAERLVEAWAMAETKASPITVEGLPATGALAEELLAETIDERLSVARCLIAERCLYGVDVNPFAVEMAKLSIWLVTLAKDRPFGFLDHALRCGDTLLGITDLDQLRHFHLDPERGRQLHRQLFDETHHIEPGLAEALRLRRELQSIQVLELRDAEQKAALAKEADSALGALKTAADLVVAAALSPVEAGASAYDDRLLALAELLPSVFEGGTSREVEAQIHAMLDDGKPLERPQRRTFHWPLEFPEVFARERPGFDAVVANPPFLLGKRISGLLGGDYRSHLIMRVAAGARGNADLCAYFVLRFAQLCRHYGYVGSLATNTIGQGETRSVGLGQLIEQGYLIYRAISSRPWPGTAALEIAELWLSHGDWTRGFELDGRSASSITSALAEAGRVVGSPVALDANESQAFIGSYVLGDGFVLTAEETSELVARDPRSREVVFPYLNGQDLSSRPDQSASRWVIDFLDRSLEHAQTYEAPFARVEALVKPERLKKKRKRHRDYWWQHAEIRPGLRAAMSGLAQVAVKGRTSSTWAWLLVDAQQVFSDSVVVFASEDVGRIGSLQSFVHREWMWRFGPTLKADDVYSPTQCFDPFPFPENVTSLGHVVHNLLEHRRSICLDRKEGATKVESRLNDPDEHSEGIELLRQLHIELDQAVVAAYGWDLDVRHTYREVRGKRRFALDPVLAIEICDRLLELNHERHAEEATAANGPAVSARSGVVADAPAQTEDLPLLKAGATQVAARPKKRGRRRR